MDLPSCLHDLAALGPGGLAALAATLFLAGLAGGATHCAGMCGPFVMAQVAARADDVASGGMLRRLSGAALLPYHAGRMAGYAALGAVAGGAAGLLTAASGWRFLLAVPLGVAALLMLAQGTARLLAAWPGAWRLPAPRWPALPVGGLLADPRGGRAFLLGLLLSGLPCGLLYGALAAATAAGSALAGGLAMLAFTLGTVPALVAVGLVGRFFGRRAGPTFRTVGAALFLLNAVVLAGMALRLVA
ncbi:sulfite exporter TauE/SafE family protein [Muricoccus radiodurans]|uniref:urease accessory protein UreH domain-containing protein n=1 Tax=Muricoccus radiodurans TaxID=2231721 RepID=UPI003CF2C1CB